MKMEYQEKNLDTAEMYFIGEWERYNSKTFKTFLYTQVDNNAKIFVETNGSGIKSLGEEDLEDLTALLLVDNYVLDRFKRYLGKKEDTKELMNLLSKDKKRLESYKRDYMDNTDPKDLTALLFEDKKVLEKYKKYFEDKKLL